MSEMAPVVWKAEPTSAGYWWMRSDDSDKNPTIIQLQEVSTHLLFSLEDCFVYEHGMSSGYWRVFVTSHRQCSYQKVEKAKF